MYQQRARACMSVGALFVLAAMPAQVLAERVKVYPTQGEPKTGELVERVPGSHIILQDDSGVRYRIDASLVRSVEPLKTAPTRAGQVPTPLAAPAASTTQRLSPAQPPAAAARLAPAREAPAREAQAPSSSSTPARTGLAPSTQVRAAQAPSAPAAPDAPSPPSGRSGRGRADVSEHIVEAPALPPLSEATRAALVNGLMAERVHWQSQYTGIATPTLLIVLGLGAIAGGIGLTVVEQDEHGCPYSSGGPSGYDSDWTRCNVHPYSTLGAATVAVGGISLLTGIGLFAHRTSDSRQNTELQRIDEQLRNLGVRAALVPWIGAAGGPSAGLRGRLTF